MKIALSLLTSAAAAAAAAAFAPAPLTHRDASSLHAMQHHRSHEQRDPRPSVPPVMSSRREFAATSAAAVLAAWLSPSLPPAWADSIDYSKVQDLLGVPETTTQAYVPKSSRPTWLTEPTEEFKANEARASDFKRAQLQRKQQFLGVLEKLETDPNDESRLAGDLDELRRLVRASGGLPLGVTKDELVKRVRRRKAKRYWPTNVEIAYQDLIQEITFQQSPNTEKDMDNPF